MSVDHEHGFRSLQQKRFTTFKNLLNTSTWSILSLLADTGFMYESCKYIEGAVADSRQEVVIQRVGWADQNKFLS
jgi:hypothetical protein